MIETPLSGHFIVCGGNALAHNLVTMLKEYYEATVTAVVPADSGRHAAAIVQALGARAIVSDALSEKVLKAAGIDTARAIAFVDGDDRDTIHAAMRARRNKRNPQLQIVLRLFNQRLGEHLETQLAPCRVLSASAVAAPAFANQALGRPESVRAADLSLTIESGVELEAGLAEWLIADGIRKKKLGAMRMLPPPGSAAVGWIGTAARAGSDGLPGRLAAELGRGPELGSAFEDGAGEVAGSGTLETSEGIAGGSEPGTADGISGDDESAAPEGIAGGGESEDDVDTDADADADSEEEADAEDSDEEAAADVGREIRAVMRTLSQPPPISRTRRARLLWGLVDVFRFFTSAKLRVVLIAALIGTVGSFAGIWYFARPFGWALYETLLDVAGSAVPDTYGQHSAVGGVWQRVFQVAITFSGILLVPVVTAVVLENTASRRSARKSLPSAGVRGHVIVVGIGNVGTRVADTLSSMNVPVVGIERDPAARGIAAVQALDKPVPVLVGDAPIAELLKRAHVERARAVVAVTGDDIVNLEAALEARALAPDVRVVIRLFEDDFAASVYRRFKNVASRSVSYLAAPAFAAAMMGRGVLGTLSVYRRVLIIAEVGVEEGSGLVGVELADLDVHGKVRVLACRPHDSRHRRFIWHFPERTRLLAVGDAIIVAATRAGLADLYEQAG